MANHSEQGRSLRLFRARPVDSSLTLWNNCDCDFFCRSPSRSPQTTKWASEDATRDVQALLQVMTGDEERVQQSPLTSVSEVEIMLPPLPRLSLSNEGVRRSR